MNAYVELPVENIELDKSNPRIARGVAYYGENITSETITRRLPVSMPRRTSVAGKQASQPPMLAPPICTMPH